MNPTKFQEKIFRRPMSRRQNYFLLVIIVSCGTLYTLYINYDIRIFSFSYANIYSQYRKSSNSGDDFTIKTEGCSIPALDPFDKNVKMFTFRPDVKPCPNANFPLLENNKSHIWLNMKKQLLNHYNITDYNQISCCYSSFFRPNFVSNINSHAIDDRIQYNPCVNFSQIIHKKSEDEYVRVTCYDNGKEIYDQFFLFAPKKNITLYDDRKEISKDKEAYNVLILGIDNVSRMNFQRTMPKTFSYLMEKGAVELLGYNKIGENSFPNLVALLMGHEEDELKKICQPITHTTFDDCPFVWHWYKEAGYYTAFAEDSSFLGTFNYLRDGFRKTPTDYYGFPFVNQAQKYAGKYKLRYTPLCMNEKYFYKVILNYVLNITETLRDSKLFGFFWETSISHDYLNYPMVMDDTYKDFFTQLETSFYLDKTIIFLVSDHGIRWGPIRATKQGYLEERLPFVYVLTPESFRTNHHLAFTNLLYNSRRLTTPFDVYETLQDLIDLKEIDDENIKAKMNMPYASKRGISLFMPIPTNRTCALAGINNHWCTCHRSKNMHVWTDLALLAGRNLVNHINRLLNNKKDCWKLELEDVIEAKEMITDTSNDIKETNWREFVILIRTTPGTGLFEATMRLTGDHWEVIGTVSRLNIYGDQSVCISDPHLKPYCYCN